MAVNQDQYKAKLRSRNTLQIGTSGKEEEEERQVGNSLEGESASEIGLDNSQQEAILGDKIQKEVPVVNMEDFEIVNMDDKLNLLMPAINKINTNFHHKFEAMEKQMAMQFANITSRVAAVETSYEEVLARVDDMEGLTSKIPNMEVKLKRIEELQLKMNDEIAVIKGVLQVEVKISRRTRRKWWILQQGVWLIMS